MFKNSFIIFVALLISGIMNFAAISIFSRLLSPVEYGIFALATASSSLAMAFLFQWILHGFVRFLPQKELQDNKIYLSNFLLILASVSVGLLFIASLAFVINKNVIADVFTALPVWVWILVPCVAIFESLYTAVSHYTRLVRENIKLYAVTTICRSIIYIGLGYFLILSGYSYSGLLFALVLSYLLPSTLLWLLNRDRKELSKTDIKKNIIREITTFGFPIIAVTTIQTAIGATDKFLLTFFIDTATTGQFAVALDLVTKSLIFLMIIVHRTTYPLLIKKFEHESEETAKEQYRHNAIMLLSLSVPACAGLAILASNIATILLGAEFQETASQIIPFLVFVSFVNCAFQFYLTPSFHLAKKTQLMILPVLSAFIVNIIISSLLIPSMGINGAIIGSLSAYITGFVIALLFIKKVFPLPFPAKDILKIICATMLMSGAIWGFQQSDSIVTLISAIALGGCVYFCIYLLLNVGGYRQFLAQKLKSKLNRI